MGFNGLQGKRKVIPRIINHRRLNPSRTVRSFSTRASLLTFSETLTSPFRRPLRLASAIISVENSIIVGKRGELRGEKRGVQCAELQKGNTNTIWLLKYVHIRDGFFIGAKLSGGRRSSATLTEAKQREGGKDTRR